MNDEFIGLMEVSVPYWKIIYAHKAGKLPRPRRILDRLAYTAEDEARIRSHFALYQERPHV